MRPILAVVAVMAGLLAGLHAQGASLETLLMPGQVIAGHARFEQECTRCHDRADRGRQSQLCMECHKDMGIEKPVATNCTGCHKEKH